MELRYLSYVTLIVLGAIMIFGTFFKLVGIWTISSDWFWFLAGVGVVIEGVITLLKQRKFDKKYKIIER